MRYQLLALLTIVLVGCTHQGILVQIDNNGGLCTTGTCQNTVIIYNDGTVTTPTSTTKLDAQTLQTLKAEITATDFTSIEHTTFNGTCPSNYDGPATTFTFYNPNKITIPTCTYQVDLTTTPFQLIESIMNQHPTPRTPV